MASLRSMILDGHYQAPETQREARITKEMLAALKSTNTTFVDAQSVYGRLLEFMDRNHNFPAMPLCARPPFHTVWLEATRPIQPQQRIGALVRERTHKNTPPLQTLMARHFEERGQHFSTDEVSQSLVGRLSCPVTVELDISLWYDRKGVATLGDHQVAFLDYYGKYIASIGSGHTYHLTEDEVIPDQVVAHTTFLWVFYSLAGFHPTINGDKIISASLRFGQNCRRCQDMYLPDAAERCLEPSATCLLPWLEIVGHCFGVCAWPCDNERAVSYKLG